MYGNVREWVEDDWHDSYEGAPAEGIAWVDNPRSFYRVIRGGSWESDAYYCSSAMRFTYLPDHRFNVVGFRLARSIIFGHGGIGPLGLAQTRNLSKGGA
jgi:formylglycine-generating enzyme required for sulfatase activity